jgi:hypothetical protein
MRIFRPWIGHQIFSDLTAALIELADIRFECPVYHSAPSGATAGSCGREFGVGTSCSRMTTPTSFASLVAGRDTQTENIGIRKRRRIVYRTKELPVSLIISSTILEAAILVRVG